MFIFHLISIHFHSIPKSEALFLDYGVTNITNEKIETREESGGAAVHFLGLSIPR